VLTPVSIFVASRVDREVKRGVDRGTDR